MPSNLLSGRSVGLVLSLVSLASLGATGCSGTSTSDLTGWAHHYTAASGLLTAHGITVDPQGDIVFTGTLEQPVPFGPDQIGGTGVASMFLVKLHADGSIAWNLASSAADDGSAAVTGLALGTDVDSSVYVGGGRFGAATLGGAALPAGVGFSGYVAKYDLTGNHLWDVALDSVGGEDKGFVSRPVSVVSLAVNAGKGVAIVAQCQHGATLGDITLASSGQPGLCTFGLDADGKPLWGDRVDAFYDVMTPSARIAFDAAGDVVVGGMRQGASGVEAFVRKLDATGKQTWQVAFGEGEQSFDEMVLDASGNAVVLGSRKAGDGVQRHAAKITPAGKVAWMRDVDGVVAGDVDKADKLLFATAEQAGQYDWRPVFVAADAEGAATAEGLVSELWLPAQTRWYGDGTFVSCGNRVMAPEIVVARQGFPKQQ